VMVFFVIDFDQHRQDFPLRFLFPRQFLFVEIQLFEPQSLPRVRCWRRTRARKTRPRSYEREHLATSRCMTKQKHCSTKKAQPAEPKALAHSTETKVDTALMVDARAPQVARLLDSALDAIAASFHATRTVVVDKEVVDGGTDHYARLTGAKRLLELTLARRPRPEKEDTEFKGATLQQMEAAVLAYREEQRQLKEEQERQVKDKRTH
jgi:hypothetical protein